MHDRHVPGALSVARTSEPEYCRFAQQARRSEFWWYFTPAAPYRGFSRPFLTPDDRGWYCVKPGFAWPIDFFRPYTAPPLRIPRTTLLGAQWPVRRADESNSSVWLNVIYDLTTYGFESIDPDKRRAIRKGQKNLELRVVSPRERDVFDAALDVWNSHVARTEWNRPLNPAPFSESWRELADWPGTSVWASYDRARGQMCSWLIGRIINDVAYVDTIASHSERLANRPNDTLIFEFLAAAAHSGARRAHYSMCSAIEPLEKFKQSLGFSAQAFSAHLELRWPVEFALRGWAPRLLRRLHGEIDWAEDPQRPLGIVSAEARKPAGS